MGWWTKNGNWAVPMLWAIYGLIFLAAWIDHYYDTETFCGGTNSGDECARAWAIALSGWAATFAASVTGFFIWRQFGEQRKQTEFLLGEAPPTLDVITHQKDDRQLAIRIVNWNRRALVIEQLNMSGAPGSPFFWEVEPDVIPELDFGDDLVFKPPLILPGWEHRSERPSYAHICIGRLDDSTEGVELSWPSGIRIDATAYLLGIDHKRIPLYGTNTPPQ